MTICLGNEYNWFRFKSATIVIEDKIHRNVDGTTGYVIHSEDNMDRAAFIGMIREL